MNLEELKTKHPDVFEAVVAIGVEQERERVFDFFELADELPNNAGLRLAHSAIRNGDAFTPKYVKHYRRAARAADDILAYEEDSAVVEDAIQGAAPLTRQVREEREVYNELKRLVGGEDIEQG
jgi:hypothetical protein